MHAFSYKLINEEKLRKQYTSLEYTNNEQNKGKTVSSSLKLRLSPKDLTKVAL